MKTSKKRGSGLRFLLIAILLCITGTLSAQGVIDYNQNTLRFDDVLDKQEVNYFPAGSSGENVIWDFRDIDFVDDYHVEYFCDSDSIVLTALEPEIMKKYVTNTDTLIYIGYETALQYMDYEKPIILMTYPFAYGSSISNPFRGEGVYCGTHILQNRGSFSVDADAYGSIYLPEGDTIKNVLRIHTIKGGSVNMNILNDTTVFDPDNLKQEIEERYQWYARGYRYPLFETVSTTNYNNMNPVSNLQKAYCYLPGDQRLLRDSLNEDIAYNDSIQEARRIAAEKDIINYDVEVNGSHVTIKYDLTEHASVNSLVCNQMGFVFQRHSVSNDAGSGYQINLDCSGLRQGVYILYLNVNGKIYNEKVNIK